MTLFGHIRRFQGFRASEYVVWANARLADQILFASSYPGSGLLDAVELYSKLGFEGEAVRRKVMDGNAAKLLTL